MCVEETERERVPRRCGRSDAMHMIKSGDQGQAQIQFCLTEKTKVKVIIASGACCCHSGGVQRPLAGLSPHMTREQQATAALTRIKCQQSECAWMCLYF